MSGHLITSRRYTSRPKALRDLLRGAISPLSFHNVLSGRHVHIEHETCLEDSVITGKTDAVGAEL